MPKTRATHPADLDLREAARHVMVDFNQMRTFTANPLIMVEGNGIAMTDHEGHRYIDGLSGVFAVSLGHGNEEITAQHRRLSFSSPIMTTTDRALELASELIRLTGGRYDVVKQLNSGSEATEAAIKMARQYHRQSGSPERYKTISFYRSYHGATMGALTSTGWPQLRNPYEPFVPGGLHAHAPIPGSCRACTGTCTLGCLAQLRDVIESEGPRTVSAVIVEPVMLTAGVHALPQDYLEGLRALCDETGVILIFDESNPVSAACGLAVIRYFEEHGVLENVRARGAELEGRLRALQARYPIVGDVRGRGLLYCVDFVEPGTGAPLPTDQPVGTAVQQAARARGLLVRASPHNATLAPPLVVTAADITEIADIFEESVREANEQVVSGGGIKLDVAFGL